MVDTSIGLAENAAGALAYLLGFVSGLVLLFLEKDSDFVRFHAAQSTVVFGTLFVLIFVLSILSTVFALFAGVLSLVVGFINVAVGLGGILLWLYLIFTAFRGDMVRVPVAEGIAEKLI